MALRKKRIVTLFILFMSLLSGCGSESSGDRFFDTSDTPSQVVSGDRSDKTIYTDVNNGTTGSIYYAGPSQYQRLDMQSGKVTTLRGEGWLQWGNRQGNLFTSIYESDDYDYAWYEAFNEEGITQWSFETLEADYYSLPKASPDGKIIAIIQKFSRDIRGLYLLNQQGTILHRYLEEPEPGFLDDREDTAFRFRDMEWLPDGSLLAFFGNALVQLPTPVGTKDWEVIAELGNTGADNMEISNNGEQLVFDQYGIDGNRHIFVMNIDGTGLRQITTSDTHEYDPTWSPDDNHLAFRHGEAWVACPAWGVCYGDCPALFTVPTLSSMAYVDDDNPVAPAFRVSEIEDNNLRGVCAFSSPVWRPEPPLRNSSTGTVAAGGGINRGLTGKLYFEDGGDLAVTIDLNTGLQEELPIRGENPYIARGGNEIVIEQGYPILDALSNDRIVITTMDGTVKDMFYVDEDYNSEIPALSPNGQWVATEWSPSDLDGGSGSVVTVFDRQGYYYHSRRFIGYGGFDWLDDNRLLLEKNGDIYITDEEVKNPQKIGSLPQDVSYMERSPDNKKIAFKMLDHIWVSNIDGTNLKQLTTSREYETNPTWSADGKFIIFRHDEFQVYAVPSDAEMAYVGEGNAIPSSAFRLKFYDPESNNDLRSIAIFSGMILR